MGNFLCVTICANCYCVASREIIATIRLHHQTCEHHARETLHTRGIVRRLLDPRMSSVSVVQGRVSPTRAWKVLAVLTLWKLRSLRQQHPRFPMLKLLCTLLKTVVLVFLVVHVCRTVDRVSGPPTAFPLGHRCTAGVLAGTHRCALMPRVASRQSANPLWLLECGLVDVSCVRFQTCST